MWKDRDLTWAAWYVFDSTWCYGPQCLKVYAFNATMNVFHNIPLSWIPSFFHKRFYTVLSNVQLKGSEATTATDQRKELWRNNKYLGFFSITVRQPAHRESFIQEFLQGHQANSFFWLTSRLGFYKPQKFEVWFLGFGIKRWTLQWWWECRHSFQHFTPYLGFFRRKIWKGK